MKLRISSHGKSLLAFGLALGLVGCRDGTDPGSSAGITPRPLLAQIGEGYPLPAGTPTEDPQVTAAASPAAETSSQPKLDRSSEELPVPPKLTPGVDEVVQLARAQVGDEVLLAYIENSPAVFDLKAGDILYLHDLGISAPVIAAMIRHDESLPAPVWDPATALTDSAASEAAPVQQTEEAEPSTAVAVSTAPAGEPAVTHDYFYTALSPYGTWVDLPEYGWCWQPTVAVVDTSWRPYMHGGRWIYSDCGWYWHSYYSWGWAPFHYGRWHMRGGLGWVWVPDTCWGPAWVTWRHGGGYYGWAPLPPGAVYTSGIGMTYYGSSVSFSFGFGFSSSYYCFVPVGHFYSHRPWSHCVPYGHAGPIYNNSTVINNYVQGDGNNTVINVGPGTGPVAAASRTEIQKVKVREIASNETRLVRAESLSRDGTTLNVFRPRLPDQSPTPPAEITRRQQEVQRRSRELAASESAQAAVVKARNTDRVLSPGLASAPRTVGPTSAPRVAGSGTTPSRSEPRKDPVARTAQGVTAPVARSEPQRTPRAAGSGNVSARNEPSRNPTVSPRPSANRAVAPQQLAPQPAPPRPAWTTPTPRTEPVRPEPAMTESRREPSRTVNPAYSVVPRQGVQLSPRPSPIVPSPAAPRAVAPPRNTPVRQPAIPRTQMSPARQQAIAPAPARAPSASMVPSRPGGAVSPGRGPSSSPARPQSAPSSAPRSSGGNRGR
jgi:hypothetical protein